MIPPQHTQWKNLQKFALRFAIVYFSLFITSFSFPQPLIPNAGAWLSPSYEKIAAWFGHYIFRIKLPYTTELVSDSTGFYIHAFVLLLFSLFLAGLWNIFFQAKNNKRLLYLLSAGIRYYLALQLLTYGLNKIFKWQFYQPEPNILFTPAGHLYKDIFFWSVMGVSKLYSTVTGWFEVLAALLLLFRKTHLLGAILSFIALLNIVIINFSFDISVKLFAVFLLLAAIVLLLPHIRQIYLFHVFKNVDPLQFYRPRWNNKWWYFIFKFTVICWIFLDVLFIYIKSGNYNDDKAERPLLHGAYSVKTFIKNGDTMPLLIQDTALFKRVFVHRNGYFIVQKMNDDMKDFKLEYDSANSQLILFGEDKNKIGNLEYHIHENSLLLEGKLYNDSVKLLLLKINTQKLPALQDGFDWTIDNW